MNLIPWKNKRTEITAREPSFDTGITRLRDEFDRMFDRFFHDPFAMTRQPFGEMGAWGPSLDVVESDKHVTVTAEVPGVDPKDLDIEISGNVLSLSGEKSEQSEKKSDSWYHSERRFGSFRRSVQLPATVDTEKIEAEHRNGVVTIRLSKVNTAQPRRVKVKAAKA